MTTEELLEKAFTGDEDAQIKIVHTLILYPDNELLKGKLKEFADVGWEEARSKYCWGLASGELGVKKNLDELKELAHLGWKFAQQYYCYGLADGGYGIEQDIVELKRLADLGWESAQFHYYHGVDQDPKLAEELRTLWDIK